MIATKVVSLAQSNSKPSADRKPVSSDQVEKNQDRIHEQREGTFGTKVLKGTDSSAFGLRRKSWGVCCADASAA